MSYKSNIIFFLFILVFIQLSFSSSFETDLVNAAIHRTNYNINYNGSYFSIPYPNGDVASNIGVCTDVIIRSYRALGADLQLLVHEDMKNNFDAYPSKRIWGLNTTDTNIDHRRVPNLQSFFDRNGKKISITDNSIDYSPGDVVTWNLPGNLPHIGIVTDRISDRSGNPLIVHNIGSGPVIDDILFKFQITGHYKYIPEQYKNTN